MAKKPHTVFVIIQWEQTKERVRIDLGALANDPVRRVQTREIWTGNEQVEYRPMASYQLDEVGNHTIRLSYREDEHPHLAGREIYWGESTIRIPKSLKAATVDWAGIHKNPRHDVKGHRCSLKLEKPSTKKVILASARSAQSQFKKALLLIDHECAITGERLPSLLEAAHIHAVEHGGSDVIDNGILLRADMHRLFDAGYFAIQLDGCLTLHPDLPPEYAERLKDQRVETRIMERISDYLGRRRHPTPP